MDKDFKGNRKKVKTAVYYNSGIQVNQFLFDTLVLMLSVNCLQ